MPAFLDTGMWRMIVVQPACDGSRLLSGGTLRHLFGNFGGGSRLFSDRLADKLSDFGGRIASGTVFGQVFGYDTLFQGGIDGCTYRSTLFIEAEMFE